MADTNRGQHQFTGRSLTSRRMAVNSIHINMTAGLTQLTQTTDTMYNSGSVHIWTFEIQGYSRFFKAI